jgi:hypothetical protein
MTMGKLEEVPQPTPVIDAIEGTGKVGKVAGWFLRIGKAWRERRARKKAQEYVDRTWHDALRVGQPEREDEP